MPPAALLLALLLPLSALAVDHDGDGYHCDGDHNPTLCPGATGDDCHDDPDTPLQGIPASAIHPGAAETWYDGVDQDCDDHSDFDQDHDGWDCDGETQPHRCPDHGGADCDDMSALFAPDNPDPPGDGLDTNCDGIDGSDTGGMQDTGTIGPGACGCTSSGVGTAWGVLLLLPLVARRGPTSPATPGQ